MYSALPTFVIGFHGCDKKIQQKVLLGKESLSSSQNDYDWLGRGIYFWENNPLRALEYAKEVKNKKIIHSTPIKTPAVIGAIIDLGNCFNLVDSRYISILKAGYTLFIESVETAGATPPENKLTDEGGHPLKRTLDCAVIEAIHAKRINEKEPTFDSVRAVFTEGKELYKTSGFNTKTHIHLCIRNPNCIKGYFHPRDLDSNYPNP